MKKTLNAILAILAAAAMLLTLAVSVGAAGSVSYSAESDRFIFAPGSSDSPTDLFDNFKGVMPGDKLRQDITVKNDSSNNVKVRIYVRSLGAHPDSVDFLSKLHLTVAKSETNDMAYMFDAAADVTDGMTDWVFLGTLYCGGVVNLVLNLDVPTDLGNDYQDAIGYLDWEFKVEELPVEPDDPEPPYTGDRTGKYVWIAAGAAVGILVLVVVIRKRKNSEE